MVNWQKLRHKSVILIVCIVLLAGFLRLYRISDYMTFLGDEGRDVLVVKHILEGQFTLLGPRASAGDFYTGPIYYYFMAPFLWLSHLDPSGPAFGIAILGTITVFLIYFFGKYFFDERAGLFAAVLYAVAPLVIAYSRSSWNPNPMPFFSLLILLLIYKAVADKKIAWFFGIGILYGIAFQLHYIELFFGIILALFIIFGTIFQEKVNKIVLLSKEAGLLFVGFLIGFSPFLAFEVRHGFPNIKTVTAFILHGNATSADTVYKSFGAKLNGLAFVCERTKSAI